MVNNTHGLKASRYNDFIWILILFLLPIIYLSIVILPEPIGLGKHFANDFGEHRIWWQQMSTYFVARGFVPQWNPLDNFGMPFLGYRGYSFLYPFGWWLHLPFSIGGVFTYAAEYLQVALHAGFGLVGLYFLLRSALNVSGSSACLAASLFIINQRFNDSIRYPGTIEAIAWVPWFIWLSIKLTQKDKKQLVEDRKGFMAEWLALVLCVGMSWLAGYGQLTYIGLLLAVVIMTVAARSWEGWIASLLGIAAGCVLVVGVLLPMAMFIAGSPTRGGGNIAYATLCSLNTSYLSMLAKPFSTEVHASAFFLPVMVILFFRGLLNIRKLNNQRLAIGMIVGLLLIMNLSLGLEGWAFELFYKHVPFYHAFRIQPRNNWISMIPIAFFCAMGIEAFKSNKASEKWYMISFALIWCIILTIIFLWGKENHSEWTSITMKWISPQEGFLPFLWLIVGSTVLIIIYLWSSRPLYCGIGLFLAVALFVTAYAQYNTWLQKEMSRLSILHTDQYYPRGILSRFLESSSNRMLSPVVVHDTVNVDSYKVYRTLVGDDITTFPASRFAFRPSTPSDNLITRPKITLFSFGPNHIFFKVSADVSGELLFFNTFFQGWRTNVPLRRALAPYDTFTVLKIPQGTTTIKMKFRPWILIGAGIVTLFAMVVLFASWLTLKGFRSSAYTVIAVGCILVVAFLVGSLSTHTISERELYGANKVALDPQGIVPIHDKVW